MRLLFFIAHINRAVDTKLRIWNKSRQHALNLVQILNLVSSPLIKVVDEELARDTGSLCHSVGCCVQGVGYRIYVLDRLYVSRITCQSISIGNHCKCVIFTWLCPLLLCDFMAFFVGVISYVFASITKVWLDVFGCWYKDVCSNT